MAKRTIAIAETTENPVPRRRDAGKLSRLNLEVPLLLDVRLTAQAKIQRMGKSKFAELLIEQGLSKYKTDKTLKIALEQSPSEDSEAA